jgi:8-oxo-dGTP pyrophosphatase MutT (NUDIX family)
VVRESFTSDRPPAQAAVLVPIVMRGPQACSPTVLLTHRAAHMKTHSGQIAFPGGRLDEGDADAVAAALRESQEEVGLASSHVEVLGQLPLYLTGTGFKVTPVVALIDPAMRLTANPHEVAQVFEVPLAHVMNPANHCRHAVEWSGVRREWFSMPYEDADQKRFIWGVTAGILRNLYCFLSTDPDQAGSNAES